MTPGALVQAYNITWSKEGGFTRQYFVINNIHGSYLTTLLDEKSEHIYICRVAITNPIDGQIWKQSLVWIIKSRTYNRVYVYLLLVVHFGLYLENCSSYEEEIAQEYRETILLSKYLLIFVVVGLYFVSTKCQRCLENYRAIPLVTVYHTRYLYIVTIFYGYQVWKKHQPRHASAKILTLLGFLIPVKHVHNRTSTLRCRPQLIKCSYTNTFGTWYTNSTDKL